MNVDAVRTSGHSGDVIHDIFTLHFAPHDKPLTVLDLTFGRGVFWRWDWERWSILRTTNDLHVAGVDHREDFKKTMFEDKAFDVVLFDPPFTANGASRDGHQKRYGSDRSMEGAPQNASQVQDLLVDGIVEACRIARYGLIVKTQDVTESKRVWWNVDRACNQLQTWLPYKHVARGDWYVDDKVWLRAARRDQPDKARGVSPQRMRNRPSVFIVAKRKGEKR